ncbi:MAG: inverse autotransporter beta domain-containing protein [Chlamydiia bacterium]|nr:inverse autotransporter beta domain-containing protein [Chlamydiia bacterium]
MRKICILACAASSLLAQEACLQGVPSHVSARYRGPEGIGYNRGYTTLEGFITPNWQRGFQPFLDVRGHMFDSGRAAANIGIGGRFSIFSDWALGGNLFYDFRDAKHLRSHQIGPGLELLSSMIDFRLNGYFPIAGVKKLDSLTFNQFSGFGNELIATRKFAGAPANLAFEVGAPLGPYLDPYLSIGSYYLFRRSVDNVGCAGVWGGIARLGLQVFDGITIGGEISYDGEYKTRGNGFISLSYPLGPNTIRRHGSRWKKWYQTPECNQRAISQRVMTKNVIRQEIIPLCTKTAEFQFNLDCVFADGNAPAGGDGTYASPFNDLNDAFAKAGVDGCVYLLGGTFTGNFNPSAQLLGSACEQVITVADGTTITLPPLTPGVYPVIENPGGFIFGTLGIGTISENLFVRGIEFGASLIDVTYIMLSPRRGNYSFSCNRHTGGGAAFLVTGLESILINDSEFFVFSPFTANIVQVGNTTSTIITNSSFTPLGSFPLIFDFTNPTADIGTVILSGNTIDNADDFTNFYRIIGNYSNIVFKNNTINVGVDLFFQIESQGPSGTLTFKNNLFIDTDPGVDPVLDFRNTVGSDEIIFNKNIIQGNNTFDFRTTVAGESLCLSLTDNIAGGYNLTADPGSILNVNESFAQVTAVNTGSINTTGTVDFDTGCLP